MLSERTGCGRVPGGFIGRQLIGCALSFGILTALFSGAATADTEPWIQSIGCRDARTGTGFTIRGARFAADRSPSVDSLVVGRLCIGSVNGVHAVPVSDGAGGAFIVWIESAGQDCDLRLQHISASGDPAPGWPQEGQPLCVAVGTQTQPAIVVTGAGSVLIAWKDYRDPQQVAVYLRRVQASDPLVASDGSDEILISDALASDPRLCSDGASGAWLVWVQGAMTTREIRMLHLLADGSPDPVWPSLGRAVATGAGSAEDPTISPDGSGGVFATWKLRGESACSLRLQRLEPTGAPAAGWPTGGVEVASSTTLITVGSIASDTSGVAIVWASVAQDSAQARIA